MHLRGYPDSPSALQGQIKARLLSQIRDSTHRVEDLRHSRRIGYRFDPDSRGFGVPGSFSQDVLARLFAHGPAAFLVADASVQIIQISRQSRWAIALIV